MFYRGSCHLEVPIILDEEFPLDEFLYVLGDSFLCQARFHGHEDLDLGYADSRISPDHLDDHLESLPSDGGPVSKRRLSYLLGRVCVFERGGMCVGLWVWV